MPAQSSKLLEPLAFEIKVRGFTLRADVLENLGGTDLGPNPHEYIEVALTACTAMTLQMYAKRKAIPLEHADVMVKMISDVPNAQLRREIKLVGKLTDEQKTLLLSIADKCPIHKLLTSGVKIESVLT